MCQQFFKFLKGRSENTLGALWSRCFQLLVILICLSNVACS